MARTEGLSPGGSPRPRFWARSSLSLVLGPPRCIWWEALTELTQEGSTLTTISVAKIIRSDALQAANDSVTYSRNSTLTPISNAWYPVPIGNAPHPDPALLCLVSLTMPSKF